MLCGKLITWAAMSVNESQLSHSVQGRQPLFTSMNWQTISVMVFRPSKACSWSHCNVCVYRLMYSKKRKITGQLDFLYPYKSFNCYSWLIQLQVHSYSISLGMNVLMMHWGNITDPITQTTFRLLSVFLFLSECKCILDTVAQLVPHRFPPVESTGR